jgi:hypothetical protein
MPAIGRLSPRNELTPYKTTIGFRVHGERLAMRSDRFTQISRNVAHFIGRDTTRHVETTSSEPNSLSSNGIMSGF